jgi:RNA polymerase sigma-70 factor, ECF subfamily
MESKQSPDPVRLLHAIAHGDTKALERLYILLGPSILSYLMARLTDRQLAEEVLQDVMLAVWSNASRFRHESSVRTWMLVIARNRAMNAERGRKPIIHTLSEEMVDHEAVSVEEILDRNMDGVAVRRVLQTLSTIHREVLVLTFYHQLSLQDIGLVLGCSTGTVKSRLNRAKEALKRALIRAGDVSNA